MKIYLGLGTNIGSRLTNLDKAKIYLNKHLKIAVIKESKIYETSPMEKKNQDYFLNQVIEIKTDLNAYQLLNYIKEVEFRMGRNHNEKKYFPRTIDIDILSFKYLNINNEDLVIPHIKIKSRKFVLKPWSDIASDYILPNSKLTIKQLLDNISHLCDEIREYN